MLFISLSKPVVQLNQTVVKLHLLMSHIEAIPLQGSTEFLPLSVKDECTCLHYMTNTIRFYLTDYVIHLDELNK